MDVKRAVKAAMDYVKDLYAESYPRDLVLEEVEFSEKASQWLVTVGFSLPETKEESASLVFPSRTSRELSRRYKIVNVDAETGDPISMKIRSL